MNELMRRSKVFLSRNASTILTCVGGAGVIATSVMAVKVTPKALKLIEKAEEEKEEKLTKFEIVKFAWTPYIPAILVGASTIGCIFGANVLNKRHQAALTSAYALLHTSYKEYKKKVTELYGDEANGRIIEGIAKDKYEESPIEVEDGKLLFFDYFSGQYFESTMEDVIRAEYEINKQITLTGGARLNDFYEMLDIPSFEGGECLGWSTGGLTMSSWRAWLDFEHEKTVLDDGLECYIITFADEPMYEYEYY